MKNMILIDLKPCNFSIKSINIHEVAVLVVEDYKIIDKLNLGTIEVNTLLNKRYYKHILYDKNFKYKFKDFIYNYKYPLVAHNGPFLKKLLVQFDWIDDNYPFYDSIRAIKYKNPKLFLYSISHLIDFLGIEKNQIHTAKENVQALYNIILKVKPHVWIPINDKKTSNKSTSKLPALKEDFEVVKNLFPGKSIVFTGKGPYKRNILIELAKKCGADASSNVITKKTNLLVVGEKSGSKLQKAMQKGIKIMSMSEFFEITSSLKKDDVEKNSIKNINIEAEVICNKLNEEIIGLFIRNKSLEKKITEVIKKYGGTTLSNVTQGEPTLLIHQPNFKNLPITKKTKEKNLKIMTLGQFNRYILDVEKL